jgi:O-methyltransferase
MIKEAIHKSFRAFGLDVIQFPPRNQGYPPDFRDDEADIIREVQPWTLTSPERIYALIQAVRYVSANGIAGGIVECGVWKGGSMAAIAKALLRRGDANRDLFLFDTFEGMTEPTEKDVDYSGKQASQILREDAGFKCADAPLEPVKDLLHGTGYPMEKLHFIPGKVEETIPACAPTSIALLRLDTDWYESTRHELVHLFPRLTRSGVLIIAVGSVVKGEARIR